MKQHIIYESYIDNRTIVCACGKKDCKIGVSFDTEPNIMRLTDKYGNEYAMCLDKKNVKKLINTLEGYLNI